MIRLTKFSLLRPVTLVLALVTVLYFGVQSILSSKMELTPDMNMPMLIISTVYAGASPEDVNELVSKPLEGGVATLSGLDSVSTYSSQNVSTVLLQYEYGTNMDTAYLDLRKSLDAVKSQLPDDAGDPTIYEMDLNATASITVAVMGGSDQNLYNYVNDNVVPQIEKISDVGQVSISGGQQNYIRIRLIPEKMSQYNLSMSTVAQIVGAADFTLPSGNVDHGDQNFNVTVAADYKGVEKIKSITIPLATGDVIHLSDIADVYNTLEDRTSLSRYQGREVVTLSVTRQQSSSAVNLSNKVIAELDKIKASNSTFDYVVVYDSADNITTAISTVFKTLLIAIALAMLVLFVFFGDWKASVIVGSSIPISVLITLTFMSAAGFSLNIVSVGSLALGVGMVVDNSIVVLESIFRAKEKYDYKEAAIEGTNTVISSIFGSTATSCVVFLPLALLKGLTGQLFTQLGFTIVFCLVSSFFSAIMIVPLMYNWVKPVERTENIFAGFMKRVQDAYRRFVSWIVPRRKAVLGVTALLFAVSIAMALQLGFELMPNIDEGIVNVEIELKPGVKIDEADKIITSIEEYISQDPDVDRYLMTYGGSGLSLMSGSGSSITAYLKGDRERKTADVIRQWKMDLKHVSDASVTLSNGSSVGLSLLQSNKVEIDLMGTDYDVLKKTASQVCEELRTKEFVQQVHTDAENGAPIVKVTVDPVRAEAYGLTPISVGSMVYTNLSGSEVMNYTSNGSEISVRLENPDDTYATVEDLNAMLIPTMAGTVIPLQDIADVSLEDSPQTITRESKQYRVAITAEIPVSYESTAQDLADEFIANYPLPEGVSVPDTAYAEIMNEELGGLLSAIITAIFLIFIVMAMQFESPRLSLMVMFTIPFSLIGAFGLLFACNVKISMTSMLGMLMLVGTVVNNGILYVDTVNQYRQVMPLSEALIEAGATRIRPMLMTTLTTVLAMVPMALAYGNSGELLQGLALVNIGGLLASTLLTLLLLPTIYQIFDRKKVKTVEG